MIKGEAMFGYVTVLKEELKIKDYNLFRSYYCGLCRAIGRQASQIARLGLSYDMTFLAIMLSAVEQTDCSFASSACMAHPLHKRPYVEKSTCLDYAACMSVLLVYLKFADDWKDERSIKALFGMGAYLHAVKKAKKQYQKEYETIRALLEKLSVLEKQNSSDLDQTADCFASILKLLFTPDFIQNNATRRTLSWLGYNTGRWIYLLDAFHDLEKDIKKQNYNPILAKYPPDGEFEEYQKTIAKKLEPTMTFTLSTIASSYELLDVHRNDAILSNILYLGLRSKQDAIMKTGGMK